MLIERKVDFANGYRMKCEVCQAKNWLTTEEYATSSEAMATCATCTQRFNFGPAVIDLRDPDDETLDDEKLCQIVWYHTTDEAAWPSEKKPLGESLVEHLKKRVGMPDKQLGHYRFIHENQALHLGTYEAALESMLRRMSDQDAQHKKFYLYRVRLRSDLKVEQGWRDENADAAATITTFDLAAQGVDAIRYLNAYESIGSISLAVVRGAIDSTQRISLPLRELMTPPLPHLVEELCLVRKEIQIIMAEVCKPVQRMAEARTPLEKIRQRLDESRRSTRIPHKVWPKIAEMKSLVAAQYLTNLPTVTKETFLSSLEGPDVEGTSDSDLLWLERFMGLAALFTAHDEVRRILTNQEWQAVRPSKV